MSKTNVVFHWATERYIELSRYSEVAHKVLPFLDPLFSAVVNFSKAAAEFHRRLEQVDKKE